MTAAVTLRTLPHPEALSLEGLLPWRLVCAREAAQLLGVDPATYNVWSYRGLGPDMLVPRGRARVSMFRLSAVLSWLWRRHGVEKSEIEIWAEFLVAVGIVDARSGDAEIRSLILRCDAAAQLD